MEKRRKKVINNGIRVVFLLFLLFCSNLYLSAQTFRLTKKDNKRIQNLTPHFTFIKQILNKSIFNSISVRQSDRKKRIFYLQFATYKNKQINYFKVKIDYKLNTIESYESYANTKTINPQLWDSVGINLDNIHKLNSILEKNKLLDLYVVKDEFDILIKTTYKEIFLHYYYYCFYLLDVDILKSKENEIKKRFKDMIWLDKDLIIDKGKGIFLDYDY